MKYNIRLTIDTGHTVPFVVYCSPEIDEYTDAVMTRAFKAVGLSGRTSAAEPGSPMHLSGMEAFATMAYVESASKFVNVNRRDEQLLSLAHPMKPWAAVDRAIEILYNLYLHCRVHSKTTLAVY